VKQVKHASTCNSNHYKLLPFDGLQVDVVGIGFIAVRRSVVERDRREDGGRTTTMSSMSSMKDSGDDFSVDSDIEATLSEEYESSLSGDNDDDDEWGLICDDNWDDVAASIACSCLGFTKY